MSGILSLLRRLLPPTPEPVLPEGSHAFRAGHEAYYTKDEFNPYREGGESYDAWERGFEFAKTMDRQW